MLSSTWILVKSVKMNIFHVNNRRGALCLSQGRRMGYPAWKRSGDELLCKNISMTTSSNGNIFVRVTGPLCEEFTGPGEVPAQWSVTRSFDVFFDLRLNKRLSKQPWGGWFETPPWLLWRQCNVRQNSIQSLDGRSAAAYMARRDLTRYGHCHKFPMYSNKAKPQTICNLCNC